MQYPPAHIAGVAVFKQSAKPDGKAATTVTTQALLDAGLTYGAVDQSLIGISDEQGLSPSFLTVFGPSSAPCHEVAFQSTVFTAIRYIRSGEANCVLIIGVGKSKESGRDFWQTAALIIVSDTFLRSHAFLRDSAISISYQIARLGDANDTRYVGFVISKLLKDARLQWPDIDFLEASAEHSELLGRAAGRIPRRVGNDSLGLATIPTRVWQLRGWIRARSRSHPVLRRYCLFKIDADFAASCCILERSDARSALTWDEVKDVRDGRERLGYNPAMEQREISREDIEAVAAQKGPAFEQMLQSLKLPVKGGDRAALARL